MRRSTKLDNQEMMDLRGGRMAYGMKAAYGTYRYEFGDPGSNESITNNDGTAIICPSIFVDPLP